MSQLRKEYSKSKSKKEEIVSEAALNWLAENVIIINEALDRKSVKRLISSIQKFEDTFGPFSDQVPSIKLHLDAAETGLELVITGRSSERKTSNLLKQMSYLYSALSGFFAKDLPILLKSRFFRAAKEQPDQRMDMLPSASPGGHKHNPKIIQDAIATALRPSKEEKKLLGKMYRSTKLPELEPRKIARELMSLTYSDLESLTKIGKVPMVATPEDMEEPEVSETPGAEGTEQEVATESVFRRSDQLLTESILSEASIREVGPILQQLTAIVKNAGLSDLQKPLNDLYTQLTQFLSSNAGSKVKQAISQAGAKGGSIADIFKTPGGKLLKQANMAIETLKGLGQAWPEIQPFTQKPEISDKDILNIKQLITKQVSGGFFKKAAQAFGVTTRPFPGLEPESIVDALTKSTLGEGYMRFNAGVVLERRLKEQEDTQGGLADLEAPTGDEAKQGVEKLAKAMTSLHQFATGASKTANTAGTKASTTAKQTQQTQNTQSTASTETAGTGPTSGKEVAAGQQDNVSALKQSFPQLTDNQYAALATGLDGAGFKIVKK